MKRFGVVTGMKVVVHGGEHKRWVRMHEDGWVSGMIGKWV